MPPRLAVLFFLLLSLLPPSLAHAESVRPGAGFARGSDLSRTPVTSSPVLTIPAPANAQAVTAFLPFGEVKDLVWDARGTVWTTRFLVPSSARDGVYWIHVVVTEGDGATSWFRVAYTVDTQRPVLRVELRDAGRAAAGALLAVQAHPTVQNVELGAEMRRALDRGAAERAKAFVDATQVVARIPGLEVEAELRPSGEGEAGWAGALDLPRETAPGRYTLEVTATDVAGHRHVVHELIEVVGPAVSAVAQDNRVSP